MVLPSAGPPPRAVAAMLPDAVPRVAPLVWLVLLCASTFGETGAALLRGTPGLGLAGTTAATAGLLAVGLVAQHAIRRHVPAIWWADVVVVGVVGTLLADDLIDGWGVPAGTTTTVFTIGLGVACAARYRSGRLVRGRATAVPGRQAWSWGAVLCATALGTAAGTWCSTISGLGTLPAVVVCADALAVVAVLRFGFGASGVLTVWVAALLTRPFGAALGALLTAAPRHGGLGLGAAGVSDALLVVVAAAVVAFTIRSRATSGEPADA